MNEHEKEAKDFAEESLRDSNPNATGPEGLAGGMGVSSERIGDLGDGLAGTDGFRVTSVDDPLYADDTPPEQRPGGEEPNSDLS